VGEEERQPAEGERGCREQSMMRTLRPSALALVAPDADDD
jgi:hypothetical protein